MCDCVFIETNIALTCMPPKGILSCKKCKRRIAVTQKETPEVQYKLVEQPNGQLLLEPVAIIFAENNNGT